MLFAIIGGIIVGVIIAGSVSLAVTASFTVPPKSLARKWRNETRIPGRNLL